MKIHHALLLSPLILAGCSGWFEPAPVRTSDVDLRTTPPGARCLIEGRGGYRAEVETPAHLPVPEEASPLAVSCLHPGFHPTRGSLETSREGWIVSTSRELAILGSDGLSHIGIHLGEPAPEAKPAYAVEMKPVVPRSVYVHQRDGQDNVIDP